MESYTQTLLEHPFFQGMKEEDVRLVAECGKEVTFQSEQVIFRQDEVAVRFFVILEGTVALQIRMAEQHPLTIQTLSDGTVLGWSWIFPHEEWKFDARVIDPVKAIVIDTRCLHAKVKEHPGLGYELFRRFAGIMVERLQATRMQLMDIYRPGVSTSLH